MNTQGNAAASDPKVQQLLDLIEAARVTLTDLHAASEGAPTVGEYVDKVLPTFTEGSQRAYGTYVTRFAEQFADRAVADITVTDLRAFTRQVQQQAAESRGDRRNSRDGRSAEENAITGLRAIFARAVDEKVIAENPASKVPKPPRGPSTRLGLNQDQIAELHKVSASGGDDPELDGLIVRFLLETGARREGLLALRLRDIDLVDCTVLLREKNNKDGDRQPVSPTTARVLVAFAASRGAVEPNDEVFRFRPARGRTVGRPLTTRRLDTLSSRWTKELSFGRRVAVTPHILRHTAIGLVETTASYAVARGFARHRDARDDTHTYLGQSIHDVAQAVEDLTDESHPLARRKYNLGASRG